MAVDLEIARGAMDMEIDHATRGAHASINELRFLLDRIERDLKAGTHTTSSNSHGLTELFHHLGQRNALIDARKYLEDK